MAFCAASVLAGDGKPGPLNNDPGFRGFSDKLDKALGWGGYNDPKQSKTRGALHAAYHELQYRKTGNPREHERAKDQWGRVTGGRQDNLKKYDQKRKEKK